MSGEAREYLVMFMLEDPMTSHEPSEHIKTIRAYTAEDAVAQFRLDLATAIQRKLRDRYGTGSQFECDDPIGYVYTPAAEEFVTVIGVGPKDVES